MGILHERFQHPPSSRDAFLPLTAPLPFLEISDALSHLIVNLIYQGTPVYIAVLYKMLTLEPQRTNVGVTIGLVLLPPLSKIPS